MTLATLSADTAKWLNRTDLTAVLPDFVRQAESEIAADKRLRGMCPITTTPGVATTGDVQIPADMLELLELEFEGRILEEVPWGHLHPWKHDVFARRGQMIQVIGERAGNYELTYVQRFPALVNAGDTNALMDAHPDVYLWKCCELGSIYLRDVEGAQGYRAKYESVVDGIVEETQWRRWGGRSRAVMASGVV